MTTDENIMQEMLDRITNPKSEKDSDELGIQMFCLVVQSNGTLVQKAHEMILSKLRNPEEATGAVRAIRLLDECMIKCGTEFQQKTAKNRFLNSLIELVSPNYQGNSTPAVIKQAIMDCLQQWCQKYPHETKIVNVYESLKQGAGHSFENGAEASGPNVEPKESILGPKEENFAKLLQSRNPEDLKQANLLLQQCVIENTRREELILQHKNELQEVQTTVGLFNQMLDVYASEGDSIDNDTITLIQDLYKRCKRHQAIVSRLPMLLKKQDSKLIQETIDTNSMLMQVLERYKTIMISFNIAKLNQSKTQVETPPPSYTDLLSVIIDTNTANVPKTMQKQSSSNLPIDELSDIFSSLASNEQSDAPTSSQMPHTHHALFGNLEILEPVSVFNTEETCKTDVEDTKADQKRAMRELREIDQMSEALFKQNLNSNERIGSFKREIEKVTLNDLVKEKSNIKSNLSSPQHTLIIASEIADNIKHEQQNSEANNEDDDDFMLNTFEENASFEKPNNETKPDVGGLKTTLNLPQKALSEINIDLDDIIPTGEERLLLEDDDVKITLNLTSERPSKNVSVIVISVTNKSKLSLNEFQFEASVKKPCKVRLLSLTMDNVIAPHKPFRPPAPISQVMLLYNPSGQPVNVTCIVGYKLGDDPDPFKESIIAKDLPFVE